MISQSSGTKLAASAAHAPTTRVAAIGVPSLGCTVPSTRSMGSGQDRSRADANNWRATCRMMAMTALMMAIAMPTLTTGPGTPGATWAGSCSVMVNLSLIHQSRKGT